MIAWLALGLAAPVLSAQGEARAPVPRAAFERVLYLHGGPARDAAFWERVRALGASAVSVSVGQDPQAPADHGLRIYGDQLAGKGVLELRAEQFEPVRDRYESTRDPRVLVRPSDLADPTVIAGMGERVERALTALLPFRPVAASIADEPSATRHVNPLDLCASAPYVAAFREWLMTRYGDVARLNSEWHTAYTGWDEVEPWTADRIRARELTRADLPRNLAPWNDQLEFTDQLFAAAVHAAAARVAARDPELPCGITGMQPPSAYGGYDYRRLIPGMTLIEAYPIGGARELAASFAANDALLFATLFPSKPTEPAAMVDARLANLIAHGLAGVVVWSSGDVFDEAGELTRFGADFAHAWQRLAPIAARFGRARLLRSRILIVESQPSVRAHWMIDSSRDGRSWVRRLSSHEAEHSTSMAARRSWLRLFEDLGYQPGFVAAVDLPACLDREAPMLLVLPATLALADAEARAIARFVEQGGHLVADHGAGIYDERLRRRDAGALDELFGITGRATGWADQLVLEGRADPRVRVPESGAGVAERGIHGRVAQALPGDVGDVQIEARFGKGRATYLNLAVCEYATARLDPARIAAARDLRSRVRRVVDDAGIPPLVFVVAEGLPTCIERMWLRAADGGELLAVRLNALDSKELMADLAERGPFTVELVFPEPVALRDLTTGAELHAVEDPERGPGHRVAIMLDAWIGAFLAVEARGR